MFKCICECSDGVLFNAGDLVGLTVEIERAGDFYGSSSVDDATVSDEVSDNAETIMNGPFGFFADHITATSD